MQHKKKLSDQESVHTQREDKEWKYQKKSVAGGWLINFQELSRQERQRKEASLYCDGEQMDGQPMERSKMRRGMVSFGNSQNKASSVVLNFL